MGCSPARAARSRNLKSRTQLAKAHESLLLVLNLINLIGWPFIASLLLNPSCLRNAIVALPPLEVQFSTGYTCETSCSENVQCPNAGGLPNCFQTVATFGASNITALLQAPSVDLAEANKKAPKSARAPHEHPTYRHTGVEIELDMDHQNYGHSQEAEYHSYLSFSDYDMDILVCVVKVKETLAAWGSSKAQTYTDPDGAVTWI